MQVSLNNQTNTPQFGMAIKSNENVNKLIKSRLKNSEQLKMLNKIIDQQAENDIIDITLLTDGKYLTANAYPRNSMMDDYAKYSKSFSENGISQMFQGVVGFIEKVANYADKTAAKIRKSIDMNVDGMNVDTVLKKMDDTKLS